MIKNIIFDFNGTIIDDAITVLNVFNQLCEKEGLPQTDIKEYKENFCFPAIKYYILHGFTCDNFGPLADDFQSTYRKVWYRDDILFPGVVETLKELKKLGYRLFILSATQKWFLDEQVGQLGLTNLFEEIVGTDNNHGASKVAFGEKFIAEKGLEKNETVMVGDTEHDFEVAHALGIKCILTTAGHCTRERLSKLSVPLFDNYSELISLLK